MNQQEFFTLIGNGLSRASIVMGLAIIACLLALILLYVQNIDRKTKINKKNKSS